MAKIKQLKTISSESAGNKARRKEKESSAKLRSRKSFDDQSGVEKVFKWVKESFKTKPILTPEEIYQMRKEGWIKE